jgi:hypothetical protein
MIATHLPTLTVTEPADETRSEAAACRWASAELADLIDRAGPDSLAGMVLRQAQRELASVARQAAPRVVGPLKIHRAA